MSEQHMCDQDRVFVARLSPCAIRPEAMREVFERLGRYMVLPLAVGVEFIRLDCTCADDLGRWEGEGGAG